VVVGGSCRAANAVLIQGWSMMSSFPFATWILHLARLNDVHMKNIHFNYVLIVHALQEN
jgi:hypothetical protein